MVTEQRKRALAMFSDNRSEPKNAQGMEAERMAAMRAQSEKLKAMRLAKHIAGMQAASQKKD